MKTCSKCGIEKPLTEYCKHKRGKDGFSYDCKSCRKEINKNWSKTSNGKSSQKKYIKKWIYRIKGVYEWIDGDICLYVGQSNRLNSRINNHKYWFKNPHMAPKSAQYLYQALQQHPNAFIRVVEECSPEILLEREQYYIDIKKPLYNF